MTKLHTRQKRKLRMNLRGRCRKTRPKTFKTAESANKYAAEKSLKDFKLVNLKSESAQAKKIRVVSQ